MGTCPSPKEMINHSPLLLGPIQSATTRQGLVSYTGHGSASQSWCYLGD